MEDSDEEQKTMYPYRPAPVVAQNNVSKYPVASGSVQYLQTCQMVKKENPGCQEVFIDLTSTSDDDSSNEAVPCRLTVEKRKLKEADVITRKKKCINPCEQLSSDQKYYDGNKTMPKVPVSQEGKGLSAKELFTLLLQTHPDQDIVCFQKPIGVRKNAVFLVDLKSVKYRSLFADDNGSWCTSIPRRKFWVDFEDDEIVSVRSAPFNNNSEKQFTLVRQYGVHKGTKEKFGTRFSRVISTILDENNRQGCYAVVQYFHDGPESEVYLPPHGNVKTHEYSYYRTDPNTIESIREKVNVGSDGPKKIYHDVFTESGGQQGRSISEEPRNTTQIYNVKRFNQAGPNDELTVLLEKLKSEQNQPELQFLHELNIGHALTGAKKGCCASPQYVLATREQVNHLEKFCTHPEEFSILGIDPTFELGEFYVTLTTFENPVLINLQTRKHPHFLGPAFVHMKREMDNYYYFFTCLQRLNPALRHIQAFGTDGEVPLMNAILAAFPDSVNLLCWIHKKGNIESYLTSTMNVSSAVKNEIVRNIFGYQEGTILIKGLVDCVDGTEFDEKLELLLNRWESIAPGFHKWFATNQSYHFKLRMIECVRMAAHCPVRRFTTNANESLNNAVKLWMRNKKSSFSEFNDRLHQFVNTQYEEANKAVYCTGNYRLSPAYKHLEVDPVVWKSWPTEKKNVLLKKVWGKHIPSATMATAGRDEIDCGQQQVTPLSINHEHAGLVSIPDSLLKAMWAKAAQLIHGENSVIQSPGSTNAMIVKSDSGKIPHFVEFSEQTGKVTCDDKCHQFKASGVCSHSLAVGEVTGILEKFLQWLRKRKRNLNLTAMITTNMPKGAGKKSGQPTRRAGKYRTQPLTPECIIDPFDFHSEVLPEESAPFYVVLKSQTRARICYGCQKSLDAGCKMTIVKPADADYVAVDRQQYIVRKYGPREYYAVENGQSVKKSKNQNAFFHFRLACLKAKYPDVCAKDLVLDPETRSMLSEHALQQLSSVGVQV